MTPSTRLAAEFLLISCTCRGMVYAMLDASFSQMSINPSSFDVLGSSLITFSGNGFSSMFDNWNCLFVSEDSQLQALSSHASVDSDMSVVCVSPPWLFEATMSYVVLINDGLFLESENGAALDFPLFGNRPSLMFLQFI